MSTVAEIRDAIRQLPAKEAWKLAQELRDHLGALWDKQFEEDVEAGRFDQLIARAREEHATGKTRSMDEIIGDK
jgi:Arc/MetJ-type ribon-helix-helix transcriptional regulator